MDKWESRKCNQCGKELLGRLDKRFCDVQCRNTYHNQHRQPDDQYIKLVNQQIRRNRRILKDLCPEGKATVRREILETMGYDFRYFSAIFRSAKLVYFICYDYGFSAISDNGKQKVMIIQKQNYMDQYVMDPWKLAF